MLNNKGIEGIVFTFTNNNARTSLNKIYLNEKYKHRFYINLPQISYMYNIILTHRSPFRQLKRLTLDAVRHKKSAIITYCVVVFLMCKLCITL